MIFRGVCTALPVPYTENGINFSEYRKLIRRQIDGGVSAICVNGTTGEPATMTYEEKKALVTAAVETAAGDVPVIAGIGGNNTYYCTLLAEAAHNSGADAVLAVTPFYNKCSRRGLISHFTEIADRSELPVIMYNVPSRTNINMTPDIVAELAEHPNIAAIKEASGDLNQIKRTIAAAGGSIDVYSGNDDQNADIIEMGGAGAVSVLSNVVPEYTVSLIDEALDGEIDTAYKLQDRAMDLISALFCEVNPIPVKTALKMMGFDMGSFRLPLCDMEEYNAASLKEALEEFGITLR